MEPPEGDVTSVISRLSVLLSQLVHSNKEAKVAVMRELKVAVVACPGCNNRTPEIECLE